MKTITEQIKAVERELIMRRNVYPRRVAENKMAQTDADHQTECMEAVLETLREVAQQPKLL